MHAADDGIQDAQRGDIDTPKPGIVGGVGANSYVATSKVSRLRVPTVKRFAAG